MKKFEESLGNAMNRVETLLKESGALLSGHFLLSSGKHSNGYVQCAKLIMHPDKCEEVAKIIADKLKDQTFDLVVGPAMGGIIIAYEVARALGLPAIFTERVDGEMTLRRAFTIEPGMKVLIVEDVVTTAKSSMESARVIESYGAEVTALASIVDRTQGKETPLPLYSAIAVNLDTFEKEDCPLCKEGIEVVKPGSRAIK